MTENNLTFEQELQKGVALSKKLQETLQNAEDTLTKVINEEGQEVIFEANND